MSDIPSPITRKDQYLSYLTGNTDYYPTDPITREEKYLFYLCKNGGIGGGSVTPEQIQQAVDAYLEENPVQPGATIEQVNQIEKNKSDISSVKEDVSSLSEDLNKYSFRSIDFPKENKQPEVNYTILLYDAKVGDVLWFENISEYKVNVVAKYTDNNLAILINGLPPNKISSVVVKKNIKYLGLYIYDYTSIPEGEIIRVNVFSNYVYENIYNKNYEEDIAQNSEDIAQNSEDIAQIKGDRVIGITGFNSSRYIKVSDFVINRIGQVNSQKNGNYSYVNLIPKDTKVKISGFGWSYHYAYRLYAFYDSEGSVLLESGEEYNDTSAVDLELDIPEGATKLTVNGSEDFESKILIYGKMTSFEECYESMKDSEPVNTFKLITLGDSITQLGTNDRGWIKYFIEKTNSKLIANVAVIGAVLKDYSNTVYDGDPQQSNQDNNVLGNQVQKILNNSYEDPDVIMIAIGTNGGINITEADIKQAYYGDGSTLIPLSSVDRTTDAGAYRYCLETLHNKYPNAVIIWCTPIMGYESTRSAKNAMSFGKSLKIATQYSGQLCCDTMRCGINGVNEKDNENGEYLLDGLHPNVNGAKKMGYFNAAFVNQHIDMINLESE